jgi:hypothetical protein
MKRRLLLALVGFCCSLAVFYSVVTSDTSNKNPEFVYARIRYHMTPDAWRVREEPWHHDYPYGDRTFPTVLGEVSSVNTNPDAFAIVDIDSPDLFKYPFAYMCEVGYLDLNDKDVVNFREWLDRGGFVLVDDFRTSATRGFGGYGRSGGGEDDIAHFREEMKKVYPDRDFEILTVADPIFNTFYKIDSLDMKPPYMFGGQGPVEFLGLRDPKGNLQMVLNNNNDISEFWEWIDRGEMSMHDAAVSFHFGIDYAIYALTH